MSLNLNEYRVIGDAYRHPDTAHSRKPRRLLLFLSVFLPLLLATQIYVFSQPPIYVSEASVLTTAATDVDQTSPDADLQHVSIQKQLLLGQPILEKTAEHMRDQENTPNWSVNDLRAMFAVIPVTETNLLKLAAEGSQPRLLQDAVNAWIESYRQARAEYVAEISEKVTASLNDELARIEQQVNDKRQELDLFRIQHDILSVESTDNQAHARLQGLNQSLNKAQEEEVKAKAKMDAIHNAIAQGKSVVPEADSRGLAVMIEQAELLRQKLASLRGQYTDEYIKFNPALRKIPEELAELEAKIDSKLKSGGSVAAQEADKDYAAAHQTVTTLQQQMAEHKKIAAEYTSQFVKHKALQEELLKLETLQQETKQRLVDIEVKQRQKYPQVEVIDSASFPSKPIRPDYWQESAIAFAASLALGLLAVRISDYLRRDDSSHLWETTVTANNLSYERRQTLGEFAVPQQIDFDPLKFLGNNANSRELSRDETATLLCAADQKTRKILLLLLNGLSNAEIISLTADSFDLQRQIINIPQSGRKVAMTGCTMDMLTTSPWEQLQLAAEEFDALLTCAAIDGGLFSPEQINVETIRYTYALFLIRQGIKLTDLPKIIGPVNPSRLMQLGKFSPDGPGLPLDQISMDFLKNHHPKDSPYKKP